MAQCEKRLGTCPFPPCCDAIRRAEGPRGVDDEAHRNGYLGNRLGLLVLDYGCGPGGYIPPIVELLGPTGQIYALDVNPAAIEATERVATRKKIANLRMIVFDCSTGLPEESLDAVLLYDTLHHLSRPDDVLRELHRVLKTDGILSFSDHHMEEQDIIDGVTGSGMFAFVKKGKRTYSFAKSRP